MIAVTDEQEVFNLHSCIGRISDPDSNVIKELTSNVLTTACVCKEIGLTRNNSDRAEINNNINDEEPDNTDENGSKFIKKLFGLV